MICFEGVGGVCWVCGFSECPYPSLMEDQPQSRQLSLFEIENPHLCGNCDHLMKGICAVKTHEAGKDVERDPDMTACYAFQFKQIH